MVSRVPSISRLNPYLAALIAAVIGLGLSVFAAGMVEDSETSRIRLEFERRVENHLRALEHGIAERVRLIEELRVLFGNSGEGSQKDFRAFLSQVDIAWSNVEALAWVLMASGREKQGVTSYICQPEPDCRDLLSGYVLVEGDWRLASRRARQSGKSSAFALIEGMPEREVGLGIVTPVFQSGARVSQSGAASSPPVGYMIGVFAFPGMVENILDTQTAPSGLDIYFLRGAELGDTDPKTDELVHFHESRSSMSSPGVLSEGDLFDFGSFVRDLRIADQVWTVVFRPVPETLRQLHSNEALSVLAFGTLLTAFLSAYLALSVRRMAKIEETVASRTAELHDTNIALKAQTSMVQFLCDIAARANEASNIGEALEIALEEVCRFTGFPAGHAYLVTAEEPPSLRSTGIWWVREGVEIAGLRAATAIAEIHRDEGLPGKVLASGQSLWSDECGGEARDPRAEAAAADGIRTSIGLPIRAGTEVAATLEFFAFESLSRDASLVQALDFVGVQLGRVAERHRSEEKLRAARDQAEQASVAKSKFLAAASHDLRQPLQAMNLFANVLSGKDLDRHSLEVIGHLKDSVSSLEGLLNALLNISKLEAGLIVPEKCDFVLRDIFQRVELEFGPLFEKAGLRLSVVTPSQSVHSDPVLLERILRNLLANALHHTEKGRVLLGARRHGAALRVGVWDSGIGIPEDKQEAIFREFYQIARGDGEEAEGVGLGLAIVDRLGKLLEHEIDVRSMPGRGSAFTLEVPLAETAMSASSPGSEKPAPPSPFSLSGKLVMVIDDEEKVRVAVRYQIESWGGAVLTAATIADALAQVSERVPDLILADYRLNKGETGHKAIRAVRKKSKKKIPGILFTGDTDPKRLEKAEKSGLQLLHKPVSPEILRKAIETNLA